MRSNEAIGENASPGVSGSAKRARSAQASITSGRLTIMISVKYPPRTVWLHESMLPPKDSTASVTAATMPGWSSDITFRT